MQLSNFLLTILAAAPAMARAMPTMESDPGHIETIVFKRDAVLTPRDLELAKRHGVDVNKMFKHSLVRRTDGDDITVWVHNSYEEEAEEEEEEAPAVKARQLPLSADMLNSNIHPDMCSGSTFEDRTGNNSPFTGGVSTMRNWALSRRGGFGVLGRDRYQFYQWYTTLVTAGSNSGANAHFNVIPRHDHLYRPMRVGTYDIGDISRDSLTRFQRQTSNGWRMEARGRMPCATGSSSEPRSVDVLWLIGPVYEPLKTGGDY